MTEGADESRSSGLDWLGDDPISGREQDRLDRGPFAKRAAALVQAIAETSPSSVAGLIGPWGSGKTSVLALIEEELADADGWTVVAFNPWELNDLGSLVREFLTTLRAAMGRNKRARKAVSKYARKIAPYAGVIPVIGSAGSKALDAAGEHLLGDTSLDAQRRELERALGATKQRILVMIDDVDRLQADELATVLKLVRLVGRLPNIYYVLAYDETTLLDVLASTEVGGRDRHRALAYLDKIVQLRLDLPPVSAYRIRSMVDRGIDEITDRAGVTLTDGDTTRLSSVYFNCLEPSLSEPRHVKRFFAQVDAVYELVAHEVDFVDLFLITFLRVFFPAVHRDVLAAKADLTGTKFEIEKTTDEDRIHSWQERLKVHHALDETAVERVMGLLGAMFGRLKRYSTGTSATRSIGTAEYFDRYMYLAIAPDDYSDTNVRLAVEEATMGSMGARCDELVDRLADATEPIVEKLRRYEPESPETARFLLALAARVAAATPDNAGLLGFTSRRAHHWVTMLLERADVSDAQAAFTELRDYLSLNEVAAALSSTESDNVDARGTPVHLSGLGEVVGEELFANLEEQATKSPADLGTEVLWTVVQWEHFAGDPDTTRSWVRARVESGAWPAEDFVALFVRVAVTDRGTQSLMDFDLSDLEMKVGVDWILKRFSPTVSDQPVNWHTGGDTTFTERRRRAHHVLAQEAARRAS